MGVSDFRGWSEILLLGKALKFGIIFQKFALKLRKNFKMIEKNYRNMQVFAYILNYRNNKEYKINK